MTSTDPANAADQSYSTTPPDALERAVAGAIAAARTGDEGGIFAALFPPRGEQTPTDELAAWYGNILWSLAFEAVIASGLQTGCSREAVAAWVEAAVGPVPSVADVRSLDPQLGHHAAADRAADSSRYRQLAVDMIWQTRNAASELDSPGVAAHHETTVDSAANVSVISLLTGLAAHAGAR
ncbi:hypothetical protein [Streptomyces sp. TE33382]